MNYGKIQKISLKKNVIYMYTILTWWYIKYIFNIFSSYSKFEGHTRGLALSSIWYTYKCIGRFKVHCQLSVTMWRAVSLLVWFCGGLLFVAGDISELEILRDKPPIRIGAFNIQIFGKTKFSKPEVVQELIKVRRVFLLLIFQVNQWRYRSNVLFLDSSSVC